MAIHDASEIGLNLGAPFLGLGISLMLGGLNYGQMFHYYNTFRADARMMKILVMMVGLCDTLASCFALHSQWYYVITKCAGNGCTRDVWSTPAVTIPQNLCSFLAKLFYVFRLWSFGKHKATLILPVILLVALGISYSYLPIAYKHNLLSDLQPSSPFYATIRWRFISSTVILTSADISITVGMYYVLRSTRERAIGTSRSLINTLITYAVVTGLLAMLIQIIYIIALVAFPGTFLFQGIYFVLGKVDVVCMLAAVNSREALRTRVAKLSPGNTSASTTDGICLDTMISPAEATYMSYDSRYRA